MAASYPTSVKSFTALNAGDIVEDTHPEAAYDEITAIETALLTSGLAHNLTPDASANARTLGSTAKFWGLSYLKGLAFAAASELTIASGAVTVTQGYHKVDTESDAASDDLVTITAGSGIVEGFVLVLRAENVARVVTLKDGSGNLLLNGDYAMSATDRTITLLYDGTNWRELARSVENTTTALQCSVYNSAVQSVASGAYVALTFDSEDHDTGTLHSTSSNTSRITIPSGGDGLYLVGGAAKFPAIGATFDASIRIRKNGSTVVATESLGGPTGASLRITLQNTALLSLAAADYLELEAFQNTGGAINVGGATRDLANQFWAVRVR